jgi:hypothetical protein
MVCGVWLTVALLSYPLPQAAAQAPTELPKVVVVAVGDADDHLKAGAASTVDALAECGCVRLPADASLAGALAAEEGTAGDGLDDVRRVRRGLGLSEAQDAPGLAQLASIGGAEAVVIVQARGGAFRLTVFHPARREYFTGAMDLPAAPEAIARFVSARTDLLAQENEVAVTPSLSSAAAPRTPTIHATATPPPSAAVRVLPAERAGPESDLPPAPPSWLEARWPYLVAALGVVAGAVLLVVVTSDRDEEAPVLRIVADPP